MLAALSAWVEHYDSGEWDDSPGRLALLYDLERVTQLLRDGAEPFHPDPDRLAFATYLIDLGCQPHRVSRRHAPYTGGDGTGGTAQGRPRQGARPPPRLPPAQNECSERPGRTLAGGTAETRRDVRRACFLPSAVRVSPGVEPAEVVAVPAGGSQRAVRELWLVAEALASGAA